MPKKPKFKPIITRVKLNPEQAVMSCCAQPQKGRGSPEPVYQCISAEFCPAGGIQNVSS